MKKNVLLLSLTIIMQASRSQPPSLREAFTRVYTTNHWNDPDSVSGPGSNLTQTETLRRELPLLFKQFNIQVILDAPCGDFFWMSKVDLSGYRYIGADIVPQLIEKNCRTYATSPCSFIVADLSHDPLPRADLIFCRDCLVHLSFDEVVRVLRNFKASGAKYLLTTTFVNLLHNSNVVAPDWRPLNLTKPPFNFPQPLLIINEGCTQGNGRYADKSLGLWLLEDIEV